jgi:hypothetical protein
MHTLHVNKDSCLSYWKGFVSGEDAWDEIVRAPETIGRLSHYLVDVTVPQCGKRRIEYG